MVGHFVEFWNLSLLNFKSRSDNSTIFDLTWPSGNPLVHSEKKVHVCECVLQQCSRFFATMFCTVKFHSNGHGYRFL